MIFLWILFIDLFNTSSARSSEFNGGNVILSQIKVKAGNIKETTLAKYFVKVTAHPSFPRLIVIRLINRVH